MWSASAEPAFGVYDHSEKVSVSAKPPFKLIKKERDCLFHMTRTRGQHSDSRFDVCMAARATARAQMDVDWTNSPMIQSIK